jgi:hypothetical protein
MKKLILAMLLLSSISQAADPVLQYHRDWSHIGNSFAVQTVMYGVFRKGVGMNKWQATGFSLVSTLMITTLYSLNNNIHPDVMPRTVGMNAIGMALSAGTCIAFDF